MIDYKKAISLSHFQLIQAHFVLQVWTVCWRAPVEKHNDRAMITLYQLKTNANARFTSVATSDALPRGHGVCWNEPATSFWPSLSGEE